MGGEPVPCREIACATFELPDVRVQPQHWAAPAEHIVEKPVRQWLVERRADVDDCVVACKLTTLIPGDRLG